MKVLFLHGWQSVPGGVKPTYLALHGHEVINPKLPDEDFAKAVKLHSRADDVVPFADSEELVRNSGLAALVEVGNDHRLADPEPLRKMLEACGGAPAALKPGDVVRAVVRKAAVFGLFCEYRTHEILVLIPEISWIPSFASCEQAAAVGDELEVKIVHIDPERNQVAGSVRALHPESDPWHGAWRLGVGDVLEATVLRWVERADRCGGAGGHLLAIRPAALVMLCGQEAGRFKSGDRVAVRVTAIDERHRQVKVELRS